MIFLAGSSPRTSFLTLVPFRAFVMVESPLREDGCHPHQSAVCDIYSIDSGVNEIRKPPAKESLVALSALRPGKKIGEKKKQKNNDFWAIGKTVCWLESGSFLPSGILLESPCFATNRYSIFEEV